MTLSQPRHWDPFHSHPSQVCSLGATGPAVRCKRTKQKIRRWHSTRVLYGPVRVDLVGKVFLLCAYVTPRPGHQTPWPQPSSLQLRAAPFFPSHPLQKSRESRNPLKKSQSLKYAGTQTFPPPLREDRGPTISPELQPSPRIPWRGLPLPQDSLPWKWKGKEVLLYEPSRVCSPEGRPVCRIRGEPGPGRGLSGSPAQPGGTQALQVPGVCQLGSGPPRPGRLNRSECQQRHHVAVGSHCRLC